MKANIQFQFDDGDVPSPVEIRESFNLLYEFCPELRSEDKSLEKTALHAVVDNKQFSPDQMRVLFVYGMRVAARATEKYSAPPWTECEWKDSILLSCDRMRGVMIGLANTVSNAYRISQEGR